MTAPPSPDPGRGPAWMRWTLFVLGWICVVIGLAGLVLPLVPGVLFLIVAAACFARSSPRFEAWLLGHRLLGPPIVTWRRTGAIPRRAKALACASLAASWVLIWWSSAPAFVPVLMAAVLAGVAAYILTRPDA